MSIEAVAWSLRQDVGDPTAKLILISLADHHNASTGECFPSKARLAEVGCCDERTVTRKLADMVKQGWLLVKPRYAENGRQTSNAYVINFAEKPEGQSDPLPRQSGVESPEKPGGQSDPLPHTEGDNLTPSGVTELCPPHSLTGKGTKEARAPASDASAATLSAPASEADTARIERNEAKAEKQKVASGEDAAALAERVAFLKGLAGRLRGGATRHPPARRIVKTSRPAEAVR